MAVLIFLVVIGIFAFIICAGLGEGGAGIFILGMFVLAGLVSFIGQVAGETAVKIFFWVIFGAAAIFGLIILISKFQDMINPEKARKRRLAEQLREKAVQVAECKAAELEQARQAAQREAAEWGPGTVFAKCFAEHKTTLVRKRKNLVFKDEYGSENTSEWDKELDRFWDSVLSKRFRAESVYISSFEEATKLKAFQRINKLIAKHTELGGVNSENEVPTNPYEYEGYCRRLLEQLGWKARQTPGSGDQGADVVAEKNNKLAVLQCKLWSQPVGNKAVQEVVAAKAFYSASVAAVVSNMSYTQSAKALAASNGVLLLHHNDLELLEPTPKSRVAAPDSSEEPEPKAKPKARKTKRMPVVASPQTGFPKDIFIARGEEILGPYKYSLVLTWLENGNASKDDLVSYDGAPAWVKLEELIAQVNQSI